MPSLGGAVWAFARTGKASASATRTGFTGVRSIRPRTALNQRQFPAHLRKRIQGKLQILPGVGCRDDRSHARFVSGDGREADTLRKNAFCEEPVREAHRL